MIYTTLNQIASIAPHKATWERLLRSVDKVHPDDDAISLSQILQIAGLQFALECCQLIPEFDKHWRFYAVWCARQASWSGHYKEGPLAIAVAERFANGLATQEEFEKIQATMAPHLELADGAPGKTAAATTHKVAGLGAKIAAASAAAAIAHHEGLKAKLSIRGSGDEFMDYCNCNAAYDSARSEARTSAERAQKDKFVQLLTTLVSAAPIHPNVAPGTSETVRVSIAIPPIESQARQPSISPLTTPEQSS